MGVPTRSFYQIARALTIACFSFALVACVSTNSRSAPEDVIIVSDNNTDATVENQSTDAEDATAENTKDRTAKRNTAVVVLQPWQARCWQRLS